MSNTPNHRTTARKDLLHNVKNIVRFEPQSRQITSNIAVSLSCKSKRLLVFTNFTMRFLSILDSISENCSIRSDVITSVHPAISNDRNFTQILTHRICLMKLPDF